MKVTEKTSVVQRVHGECRTHSETGIAVRDLTSVIDEPAERGGGNRGLAPTETLVAALVACTNVISNKCAKKQGIEFETLSIDAEATFDRRGVMLAEEIEVPYPKIRLTINARTSASEEQIAQLQSDLGRFCPLAKIFRKAGTEVEEIWNLERL